MSRFFIGFLGLALLAAAVPESSVEDCLCEIVTYPGEPIPDRSREARLDRRSLLFVGTVVASSRSQDRLDSLAAREIISAKVHATWRGEPEESVGIVIDRTDSCASYWPGSVYFFALDRDEGGRLRTKQCDDVLSPRTPWVLEAFEAMGQPFWERKQVGPGTIPLGSEFPAGDTVRWLVANYAGAEDPFAEVTADSIRIANQTFSGSGRDYVPVEIPLGVYEVAVHWSNGEEATFPVEVVCDSPTPVSGLCRMSRLFQGHLEWAAMRKRLRTGGSR